VRESQRKESPNHGAAKRTARSPRRARAERLVETMKLHNALIREAAKLLPEAVRQAKPKPKPTKQRTDTLNAKLADIGKPPLP